ncbi:MAG: Ornithine cyclodeaminase [Sphingomonas bacterium]|nr:Ornithine cyclodeaminase [Sphingomonas bacterium]
MAEAVPFLDAAAVTRATPMPALIDALRDAFAGGDHAAPGRLAADMSDTSSLLVMPAWRGTATIGVKIAEIDRLSQPAVRACYLLIDRATGRPRAVLDGGALTRRRTAAASVLAASYLARKESRRLLLIGTGALIAPLIEGYASQFPLDGIRIWGRDLAKAEAAAGAAQTAGYPAQAVPDIDAALAESDIISAATLSTVPLIRGAALRPGMHVDLIGAFRPEMCEADGAAIGRALVYVDTIDGALHEAGDLIQAVAGGHFAMDRIVGDLASLCQGRYERDVQAITLFKSVGTAIEDLAAAELAMRMEGLA